MAGGGRVARESRRRARAASVVVPFPRREVGGRLELARLVPSGRSLFVTFALVAAVCGAYWGARATSVFAVQRVEVRGAPPAVARRVAAATADLVGTSLLAVDARAIEDEIRGLPSIAGASVDRAFPHTLVVKVAAERAVGVARRGHLSWLVTGSGRVIGEIETGTRRGLPRLWLERDVPVRVGGVLSSTWTSGTRALAAAREVPLPREVQAVRSSGGELTLVLRHGPEVRLGTASDLLLKLTVAARIFPLLDEGTVYVDVSVPERPVASTFLNS
jgi:cell division protein FtsQ